MKLIRHKQTDWATFGRLYGDDGIEVCCTVERPWTDADEDGRRDHAVCRIPPGTYTAKRRLDSPKHGECFELQAVPNATNIQIHVANHPTELEGCIATGSAFGEPTVKGVTAPGVTGSRLAYQKFMAENKNRDEFTLEIIDNFQL